ncbi:polyhydroxyalkanoic acid system family protein [Aeoliella mucimassa]|uniref:Polyhydroxyalkanoic acid system protein (PHA_gran_rgn) n=1 Tax=Aeoliella mucimassa TaxID=2527972 RepID=A0A518AM28_9BACT|nr:polyhydroxyalkanoic acid system family protein [Aeoliella mucimassa]QDU55773.1 hypothetical protein Pan181_19680 [Aeoliella mucimassa]
MPQFNVSVPHYTTKEEASTKIRYLLEGISAKYSDKIKNLEQTFDGDRMQFSFKTLGMNVTGEGLVDDEYVTVKGNIPIAAMMFKGQIESTIKDSLVRLLKPPKA